MYHVSRRRICQPSLAAIVIQPETGHFTIPVGKNCGTFVISTHPNNLVFTLRY